ncbi:MAG TPA: hypothetical protein PLV25_05745, partial [Opitutales bacterium]|nr:hypothetical protein [Opitutales bacterium]
TWSSQNPTAYYIRTALGQLRGSQVEELGTVTITAVDLADRLGMGPIFLVGQDLAIKSTGQTHAEQTFYRNAGLGQEELTHCLWVPGNTLDKVPVNFRLWAYLGIFKDWVQMHPQSQLINLSLYGARIDGVPFHSFEEASAQIERLATAQPQLAQLPMQLAQLHAQSAQPALAPDQLKSLMSALLEFTDKLRALTLEGALACEAIADRLKGSNYAQHSKLKAIDDYATRVNSWIDRHLALYDIVVEGQVRAELMRFNAEARALKAEGSPGWERMRHNRAFFWALANGTTHLLEMLASSCLSADN